jgi:hypothetical protein
MNEFRIYRSPGQLLAYFIIDSRGNPVRWDDGRWCSDDIRDAEEVARRMNTQISSTEDASRKNIQFKARGGFFGARDDE